MPSTPIALQFVSAALVIVSGAACVSVTPPASAPAEPTARATVREPSSVPSPPLLALVDSAVEVPPRIDPTGEVDVSSPLQAFLDGVPDGSQVVFPAGSTYRLSAAIRLTERSDLSLVGDDVTIRVTGCDHKHSGFFLVGSRRISITGFRVVGDNPAGGTLQAYREGCEYAAGINIHGGQDIDIRDMTIEDMAGDCLYVDGSDNTNVWASGIRMTDTSCVRNGRMGVALTAASEVRIERSSFTGMALHAFVVEPWRERGGATDVLFADNVVNGYGVADHLDEDFRFFYGGVGIADSTIEDIVVTRNRVTGSSLRVYAVEPSQARLWLLDNISDLPADGPVMTLHNFDGLTIAGNVQPLVSGELADVQDSTDVVYLP